MVPRFTWVGVGRCVCVLEGLTVSVCGCMCVCVTLWP